MHLRRFLLISIINQKSAQKSRTDLVFSIPQVVNSIVCPQFKYTKQSIGYRGGPKASGLSLNDSHSTANPRHPLFLFDRSLLGPVGLMAFSACSFTCTWRQSRSSLLHTLEIFQFPFRNRSLFSSFFLELEQKHQPTSWPSRVNIENSVIKAVQPATPPVGWNIWLYRLRMMRLLPLQKDPPSSDDFFRLV